jgi:hypothetical protein
VQQTDQTFRANFEQLISRLDSGLSLQLQDLKNKVIATSQELEKATLDTGQDIARHKLALQRDFVDEIRSIRDAIPPDANLRLSFSGTPAEIQTAAAALAISDSDRAAISGLARGNATTASVTVSMRGQLEQWALDYTQLTNLRSRVPATLRNDLTVVANLLQGRLQQKLQSRIRAEADNLLGGVAALAAGAQDRLATAMQVLDSLDVIRDRSMTVVFLAGSIPADVSDSILAAQSGVETTLGIYQGQLQGSAKALADLIDTLRSGIPKELQPLLDAVLGKTAALLRQFQMGTKGLADLPELAAALKEAVDKLVGLLNDPLKDLGALIDFRGLLDQALLSIGIPESQQFQYSWEPKLKSSSDDAAPLFLNKNGSLMGEFKITTTAYVPLRPGKDPSVATDARLTNVTLNLLPGFPVISLPFNSIKFSTKTGEKTSVDVSLGSVQFKGPLLFVQ